MIEVRRRDYPAQTYRLHGHEFSENARYECRYFHQGREIARYDSKTDCLYLKTDLIGHDFKKTKYDRALRCQTKEAYSYLFDMLGIDRDSNLGEYTYA